MARYEANGKFFEIERAKKGDSYVVRTGAIGTEGTTKTKKCATSWACTAAMDKLVAEKLADGYLILSQPAPAPTKAKTKSKSNAKAKPKSKARTAKAKPAAVEAPPPPKPAASDAALEAALCEAIDDDERWLVHADWLQQQGDVRGEIIALSLAGKKAAAKKLAEAHADWLWADAKYLRDPDALKQVTWQPGWEKAKPELLDIDFHHTLGKRGMIESVSVTGLDEEGHVAGALYRLVRAPIGRFVKSIELVVSERYCGSSGQPHYGVTVAALARAKPTALRHLELAADGYQQSWTFTGALGPLLAVTPHLEVLDIDLGDIDLGAKLDLPALKRLRIETGGLAAANLKAIGAAKWPALEELTLFLGTRNYGGTATKKDVTALLAKPGHFPKLKKLGLCNSEIQSDVVAVIAKSPLLAQLDELDLSKGTLTDAEAAPLIEHAAAFAKLAVLDVSENYLSAAMEKQLKAAFGKALRARSSRYGEMVSEREQYGHEEWAKKSTFRYTALGE